MKVYLKNYARTDIVPTFGSNILVSGGNIAIDSAPNGTARYYNNVLNANVSIWVNTGGTPTAALRVVGTDASTNIYGNLAIQDSKSLTAYGVTSTGATGTGQLVFGTNPTFAASITVTNGITFNGTLTSSNNLNFNSGKLTVDATTGDVGVGQNLTIGGGLTANGVTSTGTTGTGKIVFDASPILTGTPLAPNATVGTSTAQIATTAFVNTAIATSTSGLWKGSNKFVSTSAPDSGTGSVGDFWFQI